MAFPWPAAADARRCFEPEAVRRPATPRATATNQTRRQPQATLPRALLPIRAHVTPTVRSPAPTSPLSLSPLWIPSFQSRFSQFLLLRSPSPPSGLPKSRALSPRVSPPRSPRAAAPAVPSPPPQPRQTHRVSIAFSSSRGCHPEGASAGIGRSLPAGSNSISSPDRRGRRLGRAGGGERCGRRTAQRRQ